MPTVSVVIPTYNRASLVRETIQSVLAGSYDDFEVVVVDDGSEDETKNVVSGLDGPIVYTYQDNQGRSAARNKGIRKALGRYLLFLDSDDLLFPDALESLVSHLDTNPEVGLVYGDGMYCDVELRDLMRLSRRRPRVVLARVLETLVLDGLLGTPSCAMMRRCWLDKVGDPYFDEELMASEDTDLLVRMAAAGCRFESIDAMICKYRIHASSTYNPSFPLPESIRRSFLQAQMKILKADFFPILPQTVQRIFLFKLLLNTAADDCSAQQSVVESARFLALPSWMQADLLYLVAVENIVKNQNKAQGLIWLDRAQKLKRTSLKYCAALFLATLCRPALAWPVQATRWLRRTFAGSNDQPSPFELAFKLTTRGAED